MGGKKDQGKKRKLQDSAAENDKSIESRSKLAARMRRTSEFHLEVVPSQQASDRFE